MDYILTLLHKLNITYANIATDYYRLHGNLCYPLHGEGVGGEGRRGFSVVENIALNEEVQEEDKIREVHGHPQVEPGVVQPA